MRTTQTDAAHASVTHNADLPGHRSRHGLPVHQRSDTVTSLRRDSASWGYGPSTDPRTDISTARGGPLYPTKASSPPAARPSDPDQVTTLMLALGWILVVVGLLFVGFAILK